MPRIPLIDGTNLTEEQRVIYDRAVAKRGGTLPVSYKFSLHCPAWADTWTDLGNAMRYKTSVSKRLTQMVMLVVARFWDSQYEFYQHEDHARHEGISDDVIEAIRHGKRPVFKDADEEIVYDWCSQLLARHEIEETLYRKVHKLLGTTGVVELTGIIGYYTMLALQLAAHEISVPEGVKPPLPAKAKA